jgi:hypothetical protein
VRQLLVGGGDEATGGADDGGHGWPSRSSLEAVWEQGDQVILWKKMPKMEPRTVLVKMNTKHFL